MCRRGDFFMYRRSWFYKRNIEQKINNCLTIILLLGIVPVFIMTFRGKTEVADLLFNRQGIGTDMIETQLPGIVAKQICIDMPKEAIKAQSVIARTQLMAAEKTGEEGPLGFSIQELQELWGEQFDSYYQSLEELIQETAGKVIKYQGNYIYAAYHQASAGNTRVMSEYYEKSTMPYLDRVECHDDALSEGYLNVFFWEKEEFLAFCKNVFPEEVLTSGADIEIVKRDSSGYVLEVRVGQTLYEGEEFRKKLNLPSACFEITLLEEDVRIVTMGRGHGFGLSQYMAGELAEQGKNYQEILQYFYKGVSITE